MPSVNSVVCLLSRPERDWLLSLLIVCLQDLLEATDGFTELKLPLSYIAFTVHTVILQ